MPLPLYLFVLSCSCFVPREFEEGSFFQMTMDSEAENQSQMNKLIEARLAKLARLEEANIEPYKSFYSPPGETTTSAALHSEFEKLPPGETSGSSAAVAGRILAIRKHGKATFIDLRDGSGDIQLLAKEDLLGEQSYNLLGELDIGDWLGAKGEVMRSKRGELSLAIESYELLTKSLRPLPEKWHGLQDIELRFRKRYLDLLINPEAAKVLQIRSSLIKEARKFLDDRGFMEVETPMLHPIPGGAAARPFVTHHNALGIDLYLRIAPELYLKRLLVAGYEKIYELNRNFRNEGISAKHNPEFTMLEAYQAFVDYKYLMGFMEEMLPSVVESATESKVVNFGGQEISLEPPWERITLLEALKSHAGLEVSFSSELEKLKKIADQNAVEVPPGSGAGRIIVELFEKLVEPRLVKPTFVMDFPEETSPLARKKKEDPRLTERFELIIGGQEIANAFSELTDPIDQRRRFEEQALKRKAGDEEAQPIDEDFLEALEYGMPPAGGLGIGIDRLAMLASGKSNIKEVITFPHLRPQEGR